MIYSLLYNFVKKKYCALCVLTFVFSFCTFKTTKIQKYLRYVLNNWLYKKNITYVISSDESSNYVVKEFKRKTYERRILGLDCEWVSTKGKRHPVALLQLAAPDGFCSLFRLCFLKKIPADVVNILEDKTILKVGVAVIADAHYLLADYGVHCEGCLDLRHLALQVGVEPRGLAGLAEELFGIELDKDWRVRCSDWESEQLSSKQIQYAAQDARIAIDIFENLNRKKICKQYSLLERLFWRKKDYWDHSYKLWSVSVGVNFKSSSKSVERNQTSSAQQSKSLNAPIKRNFNTLLHKQHYSNIYLLAPDNEVLCTISDSKAAWYNEKELADIVCDNPKTLKLRFEPSRRTQEPNGYYTRPKDNRCVVCGSEIDLRRKYIVPSEYKKYFEEELKNHQSHDVLLLCLVCHTRSNIYDQQLRFQLGIECDAPLDNTENNKLRVLPDQKALRSAARALYFNSDVIPQERRGFLESVMCEKLDISPDQLTKDILEDFIHISCCVNSDKYIPHGLKVVQHYMSQEGVESLERRWRQHFLDSMLPRYLPDLWSVSHVRD